MATEKELRHMAEDLADEAAKGYEKILPPDVIAEIRRLLIVDLMCSDRGRAQLRLCLGDRALVKSDEVSNNEPEAAAKKGGGGLK